MTLQYKKGDLIQAVIDGEVDVIAHGCNCKSTQKSGIAKQMVKTFGTDMFDVEQLTGYHNVDKLGRIDGKIFYRVRKAYKRQHDIDKLMTDDYIKKGLMSESERMEDDDCEHLPLFSQERSLINQVYLPNCDIIDHKDFEFAVINAYTQYDYGTDKINLDYDALRLCLRKINMLCDGLDIGLPKIGCGLAGGDWNIVSKIIEEELQDCKSVTIYILD